MADVNIKPDIALGVKQQDSLANLSNLVNTAAGLQAFRKSQELLPYEIRQGQAQSDLAVQNFQKARELLPYEIRTGQAQSDLAVQNLEKARELLPYELETGKAQSSSAQSAAARAKFELQQSQMKTELETQEFNEAKLLINLVQTPKLYMGADGRPDIDKLNSLVPLIAPRTGSKFLKDFTELNTSQIQGAEARSKLDTNIRGIIAGPLGILGRAGEKDKNKYIAALTQLGTEYKDNKDVSTYINARIKMLQALPDGANFPEMAILESESLLNPEAQRTLAPQLGSVNTGSEIKPTINQPSVMGGQPSTMVGGGSAIPLTLGAASRQVPTGRTDLQGQPTYFIYGADGTLQGEFVIPAGGGNPIPVNKNQPQQNQQQQNQPQQTQQQPAQQTTQEQTTGTAPVRLPPGTTQAQYEESQKIRSSALESAGSYQNQLHDNNKIIELAKLATTGKGSDVLAQFAGANALLPWTGDKATYFNELGHYLDKQAATLASTPGFGGTDAARSMAQSVSGTKDYTDKALISIARTNRALSTGNYLFSQGIENGSAANPNNPIYAREFKNKWNQVADVNALKLYDAVKNKDDEQIQEIVKYLGGEKSEAYKKLKLKVKTILDLVKGGK